MNAPYVTGAHAQLLKDTRGGPVDRGRGHQGRVVIPHHAAPDLAVARNTLTAPPSYKSRDVIVIDVGEQLIGTEVIDKASQIAETIVSPLACKMLADLLPVAADNIIKSQRDIRRCFGGCKLSLGVLAPPTFYVFRFAAVRSFRSSAKPMTFEPEFVVIDR